MMDAVQRNTFLALTAAIAATAIMSCSIPTEEGEIGPLPSEDSFIKGNVSLFMEQRCAGLDCHGQIGRPLRLYSKWGLRLKPNDDGSRNGSATTPDEQKANYQAVIGLEPEELSQCYEAGKDNDDGCPPDKYFTLQLLKKPLNISGSGIRHKGGQIVRPTLTDPGWQCLFGWASGHGYPDLCKQAAAVQ